MKKALALAIAASLFFAGVVNAATYTASGSISSNERFILPFSTAGGDVTATASFAHQGRWYKIWVHDDYGHECQGFVDDRWGRDNADSVTCTIFAAPVGDYAAEFWASSGRTDVTLTVQTAD
jgi:hypothetical protein